MKKIYSYILLLTVSLISGCNEAPFVETQEKGEGQVSMAAIKIDLRDEELLQTRAASDVNYDDFLITFSKVGSSTSSAVYKFGEMPDVVTLEQGTYTVKAEYGEDRDAGWNSPYYYGQSDTFTIEPGKITDDIGDIICRMENVKVSIAFAPMLSQQMSDDSYVEVRVGQSSNLRFTKNHQLRSDAGHFHHEEGVSLVATFRGMVEGLQTVQTKTISQIQKGYHYKITFKLNKPTPDQEDGDANGDVSVDASVTVTDVERNVDIEDDDILDDNERPKEGDDENPENPSTDWSGPSVNAKEPLKLPAKSEWKPNGKKLELDCRHTVDLSNADSQIVVLDVSSVPGFDEFYADIVSPALTPEELANVGLSDHLDLVKNEDNSQGGKIWDGLSGLGLPTDVGGSKSVEFDISNFMPLLGAVADSGSVHTFVIHAKDKNGELVVNLVLTLVK